MQLNAPPFASFLATAAALVLTASAQTTYVVDATGGPGSDFLTIQPALDAAGPFDLLEVRGGSYPAFAATRGARILALGPVVLSGTSTISGLRNGTSATNPSGLTDMSNSITLIVR